MIMKYKEIDIFVEYKVLIGVLFLFMFLVGMSMLYFIGVNFVEIYVGIYLVIGL